MIEFLVGVVFAGGAWIFQAIKEACMSDEAKRLALRAAKMGAKKAYKAYCAHDASSKNPGDKS